MRITHFALLTAIFFTGCKLPQTKIESGSKPPGLFVVGAPAGALLQIDGLNYGQAAQFDGNPKVLSLIEGPHRVVIMQGSEALFSENVFMSSGETKAVKLPKKE